MPRAKNDKCQHNDLYIDCSPEAQECGFERPATSKRLAAATPSGRVSKNAQHATNEDCFSDGQTFPGPLCLPEETIALEPKESPQSFRSWHQTAKSYDMIISKKRKTLYVIPPPETTSDVERLIKGWEIPQVPAGEETVDVPQNLKDGNVDDLCEYLRAFYHLMEVKVFEPKYRWKKWTGSTKKGQQRIGLETPGPSSEVVGIAYRGSPDGIAKVQVCLNDILDAMIDRVPPDAHAIAMVVPFDTYEDDDDDFCCGRAYGGSRISIVSSFRYHPCLDFYSGIDIQHMWPGSHCKTYVDELCGVSKPPSKRKKAEQPGIVSANPSSPLGAALRASDATMIPMTKNDFEALWFSRVARTLSHEVGHCVTLDHCVYFSCLMQGTAGMAEDVRQPPFLCPVCVEKVSFNMMNLMQIRGTSVEKQRAWILGQHRAMMVFCHQWRSVGMFAGYEAWLRERIKSMTGEEPPNGEDKLPTLGGPKSSSRLFAEWLEDD